MATKTVEQKVGDWKIAYDAIREEITPSVLRTVLAEMQEVDGIQQFQSYVNLARSVMANDRGAAITAAMLVGTGIKPTPMDFDEGF